jgi:glycosyltransferase involved in cell wall biosynthesis
LADDGRAALRGGRYKQLLFLNEYPPSTQAGAPLIMRQLLRAYAPERLDVLCCDSFYGRAAPVVRESFLPCAHTRVPAFNTALRPRRLFAPVEATLNCWRLPLIMRMGRRIVRERGVEAVLTTSYGAEMPHAAYFLAREFGLPFYYYEMDRLDSVFTCGAARRLITRNRRDFLHATAKLWLVSPAMVRAYKRLYGVEGEFMHHFVDIERYQRVAREAPPLPRDAIRLVYTGSINSMFLDSMKWFCDWLNQGLRVDGRPVELSIYSSHCPAALLGPNVRYEGFVSSEAVAEKLVAAHIAVILVSFTSERGVKEQIETSIYTKTVDYLAAGRPVLVVAPPYAAQLEHYGSVSCVVERLDREAVAAALLRLVTDDAYVRDLRERGLKLVSEQHSWDSVGLRFLSHFRSEYLERSA